MAKEHTINLVVDAEEAIRAVGGINKNLKLILDRCGGVDETCDALTRAQWLELIEAQLNAARAQYRNLSRHNKPDPRDMELFAAIGAIAWQALSTIERNDQWMGSTYVEAQKIDAPNEHRANLESPGTVYSAPFTIAEQKNEAKPINIMQIIDGVVFLNGYQVHHVHKPVVLSNPGEYPLTATITLTLAEYTNRSTK